MNETTEKPLFLFAGPTGGHLFPAEAFSREYAAVCPGQKIYLITGRRALPFFQKTQNLPYTKVLYLSDFPFPENSWIKRGVFALKAFAAFFRVLGFFIQLKPGKVIGFGSYVMLPGVLISRLFSIPVVLHEQNFVPGKATQLLHSYADCLCVSYEETLGQLKRRRDSFVTGMPLRFSAQKGISGDLAREISTILVLGGSQGSLPINQAVLSVFSRLSNEEKRKIAVIHITGKEQEESVKRFYKNQEISNEVCSFACDMSRIYSKVDIAITRAGAGTLFEILTFKIPAIVIPYPYAGGHQRYNAKTFADRGAMVCLEEGPSLPDQLLLEFRKLLHDSQSKERLIQQMNHLDFSDASKQMVELVRQLPSGKQ